MKTGAGYAVPTDAEVRKLLAMYDREIGHVLLLCILSGMRAGEAAGRLREDLVPKGRERADLRDLQCWHQ